MSAGKRNPVYRYAGRAGFWRSNVFGHKVSVEQVGIKTWEVRIEDSHSEYDGQLLAIGKDRDKALAAAYKSVLSKEEERFSRVLGRAKSDSPYRVYGKRGSYNTDVTIDKKASENIEKYGWLDFQDSALNLFDGDDETEDNDTSMNREISDKLSADQKLILSKRYKIRRNQTVEGFNVVKFNSSNIVSEVKGPFPTTDEAYNQIIEMEGFLK